MNTIFIYYEQEYLFAWIFICLNYIILNLIDLKLDKYINLILIVINV